LPVIGLLRGTDREVKLNAIWRGSNEAGYVEGRNVAIECRWAEGNLTYYQFWQPISFAAT
jgi:hypothetical protein